jgi:hypothetical protein
MERCHLRWPGALAVRYPRLGDSMRYVDPLRVQASIPIEPAALEALSPDGSRLAVIVHDGHPVGTAPQRLDIAMLDTRSSTLLWQKEVSRDRGPSTPPELRFSPDSRTVFVAGRGMDVQTGGDPSYEAEHVERLRWAFDHLGIPPDRADSELVFERVPGLPMRPVYARIGVQGEPVSAVIDLESNLLRLTHGGRRDSYLVAPADQGLAIFADDGRARVRGRAEGVHCAFGAVLAPHALCETVIEPAGNERGFPVDGGSP